MDQFLKNYKLPQLTVVILKLLKKKSPDLDDLTGEFHQMFKKINTNCKQSLLEKSRGRKSCQFIAQS